MRKEQIAGVLCEAVPSAVQGIIEIVAADIGGEPDGGLAASVRYDAHIDVVDGHGQLPLPPASTPKYGVDRSPSADRLSPIDRQLPHL